MPFDLLGGVPALPAKQNRSQGLLWSTVCVLCLLFVVEFQRRLDWADCELEVAVPFGAVLAEHKSLFSFNQALAFQAGNILLDSVPAQPDRLANRPKAGIAGVTIPVLTAEEIGIHGDFSCGKSQRKQAIRGFEIVTVGIKLGIFLEGYRSPPEVFCSTHAMNFSLGTTNLFPIFRVGKPS